MGCNGIHNRPYKKILIYNPTNSILWVWRKICFLVLAAKTSICDFGRKLCFCEKFDFGKKNRFGEKINFAILA